MIASPSPSMDLEDLKRRRFFVDWVQRHPGRPRVLDIGCGNGHQSGVLAGEGCEVLGIDTSGEAVATARASYGHTGATHLNMRLEDLPTSQRFDVVLLSEVLEHTTDPGPFLRRALAHLEPGGLLLVSVPNGSGPRELLMTRPQAALRSFGLGYLLDLAKRALGFHGLTGQSDGLDLRHIQFFSRGAITDLVSSLGLELLDFRHGAFVGRVPPFSSITRRVPSAMRADLWVADRLPSALASGFYTAWRKPCSH